MCRHLHDKISVDFVFFLCLPLSFVTVYQWGIKSTCILLIPADGWRKGGCICLLHILFFFVFRPILFFFFFFLHRTNTNYLGFIYHVIFILLQLIEPGLDTAEYIHGYLEWD
jgi:hypothetical protein